MTTRIDRDFLSADLSRVESLIDALPPEDIISRIGLQRRREDIVSQLAALASDRHPLASATLFFAGAPVVGSQGIEVDFGARAIERFQDLVSAVYAARDGFASASRGQVRGTERSKLYVTQVIHGSFGFRFEELGAQPLFDSDLKASVDRATKIMASFEVADDQAFSSAVESIDDRVLTSVRDFFNLMKDRKATLRIVSETVDKHYSTESVQRAVERAAATDIAEEELQIEGELLGILPEQGTFEYLDGEETVLRGKVKIPLEREGLVTMGHNWLKRTSLATFLRRIERRQGREYRRDYFLFGA